ncbi:alpha,alpha-phosphotrehalase [Brachyspira hyodysenteriae]|uniref:alpha,alpha-phosphotrehalase n=1 Tax=Brachyspira hyodysenteriae TaxID=159 RepID=UPI0022CDA61D|nr:alpha,alpha-phosphotrehalase [Brachyspira hyodysenteriae]MDA0033817.1 alpha,alpha-phosphotrehalase [Brachyspira hyodysenteriae]MDA0047885.1 alpha,alpha-phosphotrehalase [Brachyspira hyodysenteriae]MDA1467603.1 alpha,alpha-phosphotrehalase [Brachyspira hyodysenteriae]
MNFKNKVVYQIYPKSFMDSNNDGLGDIKGIISKLDYLQNLGVDIIWSTPFFVSPQKDNGYDVADYYNVDPSYGTMEDVEELIKEAKKRNIDIMFDMVFNHTSTEHEWFKKAMNGKEKYKNYYIFKKGRVVNGKKEPPTNWVSKFGGNAWQYVEKFDEYYLHLFDVSQADLNWDNEEVRKEIFDIVNFWIKKGVYGFRFDVINLISKPEIFEDDFKGDGRRFYTDGINIHKYLKELNKNTFGKYDNAITIGEMSSTSIENCIKYSGEKENELSMVFSFHHLKVDYKNNDKWQLMDFDFQELKNLLFTWQEGMQDNNAWSALFWCNHDQPRIVSRFGDDKKYHKESAKMLATVMHCLRGTPYIYQGEEIGMTNAYFDNINQYKDVESINYFNILKNNGIEEKEIYKILQSRSRDNSRTLMQWNDKENAGFSNAKPWIEVIYNYKDINAENNINDENSIFNHYKKLIKLRKDYKVISEGKTIPILKDDKNVFAFIREYNNEKLLVINNFYGNECTIDLSNIDFDIKSSKCILSNYDDGTLNNILNLKPYESIVLYNN